MWVLGDRKITPWALDLGLSRGMVSRISEGHVPRPEVLSLIARAEGVSLDWLLDGIGPPWREQAEVAEDSVDYDAGADPIGRAFERAAREDPLAARRRLAELLWHALQDDQSS